MTGWIQTQPGIPSQSQSILKADILLASKLGGAETPTNQMFKHRNLESPVKGGVHQQIFAVCCMIFGVFTYGPVSKLQA